MKHPSSSTIQLEYLSLKRRARLKVLSIFLIMNLENPNKKALSVSYKYSKEIIMILRRNITQLLQSLINICL
jgi:hypothetical protein